MFMDSTIFEIHIHVQYEYILQGHVIATDQSQKRRDGGCEISKHILQLKSANGHSLTGTCTTHLVHASHDTK